MEFNQCADLVNDETLSKAHDMFDESNDVLQDLLDMQEKLQQHMSARLPERNIDPRMIATKGELIDWFDKNFDAIMDEFRELKTSVGGMSKGEKKASAVWKAWKSDNVEQRNLLIKNMSVEDGLEMKFEMIDILHFVLNMFIGLGMSSKDIYIMYMIKNLENFDRINRSY